MDSGWHACCCNLIMWTTCVHWCIYSFEVNRLKYIRKIILTSFYSYKWTFKFYFLAYDLTFFVPYTGFTWIGFHIYLFFSNIIITTLDVPEWCLPAFPNTIICLTLKTERLFWKFPQTSKQSMKIGDRGTLRAW